MNKNIALIGNPNVGKTSLFNILTNTYQKVGNWTGVTVESKELPLYKNKNVSIIDLPGAYSLHGESMDEVSVPEFLDKTPPNVIIDILDGTNLLRNLSLTVELLKKSIPTIIAVNFSDELEKNGVELDDKKLSELLGAPVFLISAKKGKGIKELINYALSFNGKPKKIETSPQEICEKVLINKELKSKKITDKLDGIFLHKYLGLPIFVLVIFSVYFLSLKVGGIFGDYISTFFQNLKDKTFYNLQKTGTPHFIITFITVALLGGVGEVISFLPQIVILFCLLAILEESGYMARVAFLLDKIFSFLGLNGKSVFPLVLSLGCTATGIMATRTIEDEKEREKTIFLIPFMPCGAKTVVFMWGAKVFFNSSPFIATSFFFLGLIVVIAVGKLTLKSNGETFLLEMPIYRVPSLKNVLCVMWEKVKDFTFKAGSIIFLVSVIYWLILYFGLEGYNGGKVEKSYLFILGNILKYLFYPLGFFDWRITTSIISGILAKESVIETLSMCTENFTSLFNNAYGVYAFLTFVLLSPPCVSALSQAKVELKSKKKLLKMFIFEFTVAYIVSMFFSLAGIFGFIRLCLISACIFVIIYLIKKEKGASKIGR